MQGCCYYPRTTVVRAKPAAVSRAPMSRMSTNGEMRGENPYSQRSKQTHETCLSPPTPSLHTPQPLPPHTLHPSHPPSTPLSPSLPTPSTPHTLTPSHPPPLTPSPPPVQSLPAARHSAAQTVCPQQTWLRQMDCLDTARDRSMM